MAACARRALVGALLLGLADFSAINPASAAEAGKGVYLLGVRSQFMGVLPAPGAYLQNDLYMYTGNIGHNGELPIGGIFAANLDEHAPHRMCDGHFG